MKKLSKLANIKNRLNGKLFQEKTCEIQVLSYQRESIFYNVLNIPVHTLK